MLKGASWQNAGHIAAIGLGALLAWPVHVDAAEQDPWARQTHEIGGVLYTMTSDGSGTANVVQPLKPSREMLKKGSVIRKGGKPLETDIAMDRDVPIKMRDGTLIYADIYRAPGSVRVPVIIAYSPYGKQQGAARLEGFPKNGGVPIGILSGLQKFEALDPSYWCARGYAIVNVDPRGVGNSGGNIRTYGPEDSVDGYDIVEWAGTQRWSNGKVAFAGNSWLAITQWFIAATRPPHLRAIAPWEGIHDVYRDDLLRGGIFDGRVEGPITTTMRGKTYTESVAAMGKRYPLMNDYWRSKIADVARITVPAYVVASWTNGLHAGGTQDAWLKLGSKEKWLRIHNTHEWPDLYAYTEDLRRFFDFYLKGIRNGWDSTPKVRISVLNPGGDDIVDRPERAFPLPQTRYTRLYLDASTQSLVPDEPSVSGEATYNADIPAESVSFTITFAKPTELVGYMNLHAYVTAQTATDMDLFAYVQKLDVDGDLLEPDVFGSKWLGQSGYLRVSHRKIDPTSSTPYRVQLTHDEMQPFTPGEIVPVDVTFRPLGMRWDAGQKLRLVITSHRLDDPQTLDSRYSSPVNRGVQIIKTGGDQSSYLLVPEIPVD